MAIRISLLTPSPSPTLFFPPPQAGVDGLVCVFDVSKGPDEEDGMAGVLSVGSSVAKMGFFGQQLDNVWVLTSTEDLSTWRWGDATQLGALQARWVLLVSRPCGLPKVRGPGALAVFAQAASGFPFPTEHEGPVRRGGGGGGPCGGRAVRAGRLPHWLPLGRRKGLAVAPGGERSRLSSPCASSLLAGHRSGLCSSLPPNTRTHARHRVRRALRTARLGCSHAAGAQSGCRGRRPWVRPWRLQW